jgi:hypothetical protein
MKRTGGIMILVYTSKLMQLELSPAVRAAKLE